MVALGLISGFGAVTDTPVQERSDFQQLSGRPKTELSSTPMSHAGTALEFVVSGGLLIGAAAVNSRGSKNTNLDIERLISPTLVEGVQSGSVIHAFNASQSGFGTLVSYLCDEYQIQNSKTEISLIPGSRPFMASARVVTDSADAHKVELLIEAIEELLSEKVDQAQHIVVDHRIQFEDAFSEAVEEEVKMGKALFIRKLNAFRSHQH